MFLTKSKKIDALEEELFKKEVENHILKIEISEKTSKVERLEKEIKQLNKALRKKERQLQ